MTNLVMLASGCTTNSLRESISEAVIEKDSLLVVSVTEINESQSVSPTKPFNGIVKTEKSSNLSFGRNGRIFEIPVSVGDVVPADTTLGSLDLTGLLDKQEGLKNSVAAAQQELQKFTPPTETPQPTNTRQKLAQLQLELDRLRSELESSSDSPELADQVKSLEKQVKILDKSAQQKQIQDLQQKISLSEAELKRIDAELTGGQIIAPYDGVITKISAFEGTLVSPAVTVVQISSTDRIVELSLPDHFVSQLEIDQEIDVETEEGQFTGTVGTIMPAIDTKTRTRMVVINLPVDFDLTIGEIVTARIPEGVTEKGFWIPHSALVEEDRGMWSVFVVEDKDDYATLINRTVKVLHTEGDQILVEGEFSQGDQVVSDGIHRLVSGQKVKIAKQSLATEKVSEDSGETI